MAKTIILFWCILCAPVCFGDSNTEQLRSCLQSTFRAELGVAEVGNNGGKRVKFYQHSVDVDSPAAWCAGFVNSCLLQVCLDNQPHSPLAADYFKNKQRIVYKQGDEIREVKIGDNFGINFPKLGGVHHIGFIDEWDDESDQVVVISGNSNDLGSREGIKVCRKTYFKDQIYVIADWVE